MKQGIIRQHANQLLEKYYAFETYFTNGSFGVKFYPLLMYPCVRHSRRVVLKICAVLAVFLGIDYCFAELVTALFTESLLTTYRDHTLFELAQPIGTLIDGETSQLSPLAKVMQAVFCLQGYLFFWIYLFGVTSLTQRFRLLACLFALCFAVGMAMTATAQGGDWHHGRLQNLGLSLTLLSGNLMMLFTAIGGVPRRLTRFKRISLFGGLLGLVAIGFTLVDLPLTADALPLLERLSIYCIMVWQVAAGFAILKQLEKPLTLPVDEVLNSQET